MRMQSQQTMLHKKQESLVQNKQDQQDSLESRAESD